MRPFSAGELARMQGAQQGSMMDTCELLGRTVTGADSHGYDIVTWPVAQTTVCGFDARVSDEVLEGAQVVTIDAQLRLPIALDGTFSNLDRVRLTHRHGAALGNPPTYAIIGHPERGPSGLVLRLKRVTDGSDT